MSRGVERFLMAALLAATAACVPLEPYRYRNDASGPCEAAGGACEHSIAVHADDYDLHFVEFDDQGLAYPANVDYGDRGSARTDGPGCDARRVDCPFPQPWAYQINELMKSLDAAADRQPITLIVFVHGWKHSAREDDDNLRGFKEFLSAAALIESRTQATPIQTALRKPRRVVGVYVGWRGQAIDVPVLENLTFWSRKTAAGHVADGSSHELFARLRGFKCVQNAMPRDANGVPTPSNVDRPCNLAPSLNDRVKVVLIGHSFGGLVLYNSIAGSLIETLTHAFDSRTAGTGPYWRFADLAVLINPAFEATRYAPLQRIASAGADDHFEPPLLVTVTSTTDYATGIAFKFGRFFNTIFERHAGDEGRANINTIGHYEPFVTHRLENVGTGAVSGCAGWVPLPEDRPADQVVPVLIDDLAIEQDKTRAFYAAELVPAADGGASRLRSAGWHRDFCGGLRLTHLRDPANSPIWNVSVVGDPALLPDHSNIRRPLFVTFFRQLYMDSIVLGAMLPPR